MTPACLRFLTPSLCYKRHLLEESPERLWDGSIQLNRSPSLFGQCISAQSSLLFQIWYLTFTWHCKASSSLNSESSGRDTLSKTVSSKFHPLHLFCLFFHPFKHGLLWKSEKGILLFRSEYMVYILFSEEQELYPTLTA